MKLWKTRKIFGRKNNLDKQLVRKDFVVQCRFSLFLDHIFLEMRIVASRIFWFGCTNERRGHGSVLNVLPGSILDPLSIRTISRSYRVALQFLQVLPHALLWVGIYQSVDEILRLRGGVLILELADENALQRLRRSAAVKRELALGELY